MTFAPNPKDVTFNTPPIVSNDDDELVGQVGDFDLDQARLRVAERVRDGLAPDPVDLVPQHWLQGPPLAANVEPEASCRRGSELACDTRECCIKVRLCRAGRAHSPQGVARFIGDSLHEAENAFEPRSDG